MLDPLSTQIQQQQLIGLEIYKISQSIVTDKLNNSAELRVDFSKSFDFYA